MPKNVKTTARVEVLLEVNIPTSWDRNCPLDQVYKQAADSAKNIVQQAMGTSLKDIRIIGSPKITAILAKN